MKPQHIIIINRWSDPYALYTKYEDHNTNTVSYITSKTGVKGIPDAATETIIVDDINSYPELLRSAKTLSSRYGQPKYVVALYEDDLVNAAKLREEFSCAGPSTEDVLTFKDKSIQIERLNSVGIRTPSTIKLESRKDLEEASAQFGLPLIVKPAAESSSRGVHVLKTQDDIKKFSFEKKENYLAQQYIDLPIFHVDGVFSDKKLKRVVVSEYINTCLEFVNGAYLGSFETEQSDFSDEIADFIKQSILALSQSSTDIVFHAEVFADRKAEKGKRCTFLEIGSRVGGAGIPFLWREVYDFDLMHAHYLISTRRDWNGIENGKPKGYGGWVLMQLPSSPPCKINHVTSLIGKMPGPYAEALPQPGTVIPKNDTAFEHVAGRFRVFGETHERLMENMQSVINNFSADISPLPK